MSTVVGTSLPSRLPEPAPSPWLANERYAVLVTAAGGGLSLFDDFALTAWRPDPVEGYDGVLIYLRDLDSGAFWTASGRPLPAQAAGRIVRSPGAVVITRAHEGVTSNVDVRLHVSAGIEQRSCIVTNASPAARHIELTSFIEAVLNRPVTHAAHPAFSRLFIQTRALHGGSILMATRRPRDCGETAPLLLHALLDAPVTDFLTDRARFVGRGLDLSRPQALAERVPLGRIEGNVLDPALCLRTVVRLAPGASCTVRFVVAAGDATEPLLRQIGQLRRSAFDALPVAMQVDLAQQARFRGAGRAEFLRALSRQLESRAEIRAQRTWNRAPQGAPVDEPPRPELRFFNGYGGFTEDGREYVVRIPRDAAGRPKRPPAPWINVIANPDFGCLVSESGAGTVWSRNSREYRLTPWSSDAVVDPHGDGLYVRDRESGLFWSPMPGPAASGAGHEVRHGFGCTTWDHCVDGLAHEVTVFVPEAESLRLSRVRIRNTGAGRRHLSVYAYNRWVLGTRPESTRSDVRAEFSTQWQALLARNESAGDRSGAVAFAAADRSPLAGWCADRERFLGVPGSMAAPAVLMDDGTLPEVCGDDPCAVLRVDLDIEPGATGEVSFLLGEAGSTGQLAELLANYRRPGRVDAALEQARRSWNRMLSRLQVDTPSTALNFMINGWLPYQNISCRLWARSAFYQSGGAFGFRDQIQDAAAIIYLRPDLTRDQILLHAGRQFVEGDVQHWWHPPGGHGLRTRFADDLLWLPWATAYYVGVTGDWGLLAERVPYLEARSLRDGEAEALVTPRESAQTGDLYDHCCRAIDRSLSRGVHGLPLFGSGDWNDGMNRVGHEGHGESVWMGFFLVTVLSDFLALCECHGDAGRAARYRKHRDELQSALELHGWDGHWYRRGWYDDGVVLGSEASDECRIDALVQAWAVISRAAPADRARLALDALEEHLIDDRERLIRLLTPPFVNTPHDPGYIKGYVAGVRENGGQYTHAATWVVKAMAEAGRRNRAMELFEGLIPINHGLDAAAAEKYRVEPYVAAADVYGAEPHIGRGGWTWYTGSAGWMYRVAVETLVGFGVEGGDTLCLRPRIPDAWPGFQLDYEVDDRTRVHIEVRNPDRCAERVVSARFDGAALEIRDGAARVMLAKTGRAHRLEVIVGR